MESNFLPNSTSWAGHKTEFYCSLFVSIMKSPGDSSYHFSESLCRHCAGQCSPASNYLSSHWRSVYRSLIPLFKLCRAARLPSQTSNTALLLPAPTQSSSFFMTSSSSFFIAMYLVVPLSLFFFPILSSHPINMGFTAHDHPRKGLLVP